MPESSPIHDALVALINDSFKAKAQIKKFITIQADYDTFADNVDTLIHNLADLVAAAPSENELRMSLVDNRPDTQVTKTRIALGYCARTERLATNMTTAAFDAILGKLRDLIDAAMEKQ